MNVKAPRGTKDIFGNEIYIWQEIEQTLRNICKNFNITEMRTPMFESTELFQRGVGETTDIVKKEMYTFEDKGGRSITLKPEGTAGIVRAFIENKIYAETQPTKLYYITPVFRYERPQAGRMRQFNQFGVEIFGAYDASCDAEVISIVYEILNKLQIKNIELKINSLGGPECRKNYNDVLKKYIGENIESFCPECRERFEKNPLRVLDCKNENCQKLISDAPSVLDCLGKECKQHFETLKSILNEMNIPFTVNHKIVRGLDYYTRTVFEFVSNEIGSQGTICGGGRYDNLVEECGGPSTGAVGFAIGIERIMLLIEKQGLFKNNCKNVDIYIGSIGDKGFLKAQSIGYRLRSKSISVEYDTLIRSVKAQLKYADKINASYCVIIGDTEIENDLVTIKNMQTKEQFNIKLSEIEKEFITILNAKEN